MKQSYFDFSQNVPNAEKLQFESNVLKALAFEWRQAASLLSKKVRDHFREPSFALHDSVATWGRWRGKPFHEIAISRQLVYSHPWYAVVEVLRHEAAHQLAEACFDGKLEKPHGQAFHKACRMLAANPAASGKYPPLDEYVMKVGDSASTSDRLMQRIRKLLALSSSPNRHEAELAVGKAHELMAKYNLDILEHDRQRHYVSITLGTPRLRQCREDYALAGLLRDFHFVKTIWIPRLLIAKDKPGRILEISGTRENVQLAHYVYDFVQQYIKQKWQEYQKVKKMIYRSSRRDFALGVIQGFREKLEKEAQTDPAVTALVQQSDHKLLAYFEQRYPRTRTLNTGRVRYDPRALESGVRAGHNLKINKGIERQKSRYLHE